MDPNENDGVHHGKTEVTQHLLFCQCGHRNAQQCSSRPQLLDQECTKLRDAEEDKCDECATNAVIRQGDQVLVFSETSKRFEMDTVQSIARTPEGMARVRLFSTQGFLTVGSNKKRQEYRLRSKDRQAKHYMMRVNGVFGVDAYRYGNISCSFNHSAALTLRRIFSA